MTTKRQPKLTEEDTTIYNANTLTNTNRQQTRTKMGQPPHERTNHCDLHTHGQMKMTNQRTEINENKHGQKRKRSDFHIQIEVKFPRKSLSTIWTNPKYSE